MAKKRVYLSGGPHYRSTIRCVYGDCLKAIPEKVMTGTCKLAILDPPYNIGQNYDSYRDKRPTAEFIEWLRQRVNRVHETLHRYGSMWVFINDPLVSEVDIMVKELGFYKRSHVIWYYTFGQNCKTNFSRSHTHLLYYTKNKAKFTFNKSQLRQPSARQIKYDDPRADPKGRLPDNTWVLFPEQIPDAFNPDGDTWLASRVCGTFDERCDHSPNQIPLPIMERIVLACSSKGNWVLDLFMGTGTAGVACKRHGRNYLGIDISKTCVRKAAERITDAK